MLMDEGCVIHPSDVVRLNALGLKLERSAFSSSSLFCLPRVAYLGDVILRQPTMGHEIWLDEVGQIMDMSDPATNLAVTAYACSVHDADDLPKSHSKMRVMIALMTFKIRVRKYTLQQIINATRYVCNGNDAELYEYPVANNKSNDENDYVDNEMSMPIGIILDGVARGLGISLADAKQMTQSQYVLTVKRYLYVHGLLDLKDENERARADYFATFESIKNRAYDERDRKLKVDNGGK